MAADHSAKQAHEKPLRWKLWMFIAFAFSIFGAVCTIALFAFIDDSDWAIALGKLKPNELGDTFGAVNGIASSLALVGVVMALIEQNRAMKRERDRNEATAKFREEQNEIQRETNAAMHEANKIARFRVITDLDTPEPKESYQQLNTILMTAVNKHYIETTTANINATPDRDPVAEFVYQLSKEPDPLACLVYYAHKPNMYMLGIEEDLGLHNILIELAAVAHYACGIINMIKFGVIEPTDTHIYHIKVSTRLCIAWEAIINEIARNTFSPSSYSSAVSSSIQDMCNFLDVYDQSIPTLLEAKDKFCVNWNRGYNT